MKVFVDMDGVLADFEGGFLSDFGMGFHTLSYKDRWELVRSKPNFFAKLPLLEGAETLIKRLRLLPPEDVVILTSVPENTFEVVARQKKEWIAEKVSPRPLVVFSRGGTRKACYMHQKGDILIDDKELNVAAWRVNGGNSVLWDHTIYEVEMERLEKLLGGYYV